MNKKSIRDIQWQGKRAVVRVDFNVPIEHGVIGDDTRIRSAVPTIQYLVDHGASVVLMSHLGRPKNTVVESLRLKPVAAHLAELLNKSVTAIPDVAGPNALSAAKALGAGQILMLENTRFDAREEANDPSLAKEYAALGDVYVNDAFGAAHRAHASTAGIAAYLPAVAGLLMERELEALAGTLANPERPFITIIGGAKISDKIGVIENLLSKVDALLIGGGMANTFLLAQGYAMGDSLVETASLDLAKRMIDLAAARGTKLLLPTDAVVADAFSPTANTMVVAVTDVKPGWRILDIGPATRAVYATQVAAAKTVIWNGPMGVFEMPAFAEGTRAVAQALADSSAKSIVGGGDSVAAIEQMGLADRVSHISTGGGASLELLEGRVLPGVDALNNR
ncbi:MAG: phosphoglycerate kinase [Roseiflexaceae bacterium]